MSTIRKRTPSATLSTNRLTSSSNNAIGLKKKKLTKPTWDSTNSDLDQLKPSKAELEKRKQASQSKNVETVRYDKQRQAMLKAKKDETNLNSKQQLALLKEILYDDDQLKKLIQKSDLTLKTVQDFFTEDNDNSQNINPNNSNKKQVKINMTLAPNADLNESNLPYNKPNNSKIIKQKNTISTARIINANDNDNSSDNESEILDLKLKQAKQNEDFVRYRQLLELKQENINKKLNSPSLQPEVETNDLDECIKMLSNKNYMTPTLNNGHKVNEKINDTEKINRLKDLIKNYASSMILETENSDENSNVTPMMQRSDFRDTLPTSAISQNEKKQSLSNLNDGFKSALYDLENKMYAFEKEIGQKKSSDCSMFKSLMDGTNLSVGTMSGQNCTLSLIKIVSSLVDYQKDTIKELNHEKCKNHESNKQLDIHRKLIDGLTNEILCVKEQNEKIGTVYINQANHQAKIDAELDQIKIMLRSNSLSNFQRPPIIDSQPKTSSAFYPTQQTDLQNIIKPFPNQSRNENQEQQLRQRSDFCNPLSTPELRQIQQFRPMSCISSINEYNQQNNVRYPLDDALNEVRGDKFVERLNAMLHHNAENQNNQFNSNSLTQNLVGNNTNYSQSETNMIRSASAFGLNGNNQFRNNDFNNSSETTSNTNSETFQNSQRYNDFNSQIQELGAKNAKAHQKLKQLQSEQISEPSKNISKPKVQENLCKLKEEQKLLKDQINMLNRQRESAQCELEVLSMNPSEGSKRSILSDKDSFMQSLKNIEFNRIDINADITPNMSPIPNENIFNEGIESKSSGNRFALQPNGSTAGSENMINKNRN